MEKDEKSNRSLTEESAVERNKIRTAGKAGVRKGILITAIVSIILLIVAGIVGYNLHTKEHDKQLAMMEDQKTMFTKQLTTRDSTINDWLMTFDQIEKDLNLIKQKENIVTLKTSESELSKDKREQVLNDIKSINTLLDNNKKKLASLNARLKNSNATIEGMQTRIATLETTLKQYENDISDLKATLAKKDFEITQLNVKMAVLDSTVNQQEAKIMDQTGKLHQAFMASGTFKELKEKGIISKEGGFLGMGKKGSLVPDLPENLFSKIDITETKMIPVHSKDAKLITKHPSNSYEMVPEEGKRIAYIEIKDPEMFWKISKYAVVEISK
jgi:predicted  nucleic acid-binding Zn-ribbon protein